MATGEDAEQVVVETVRRRNDLLDLEFRRDVQVVADMARLEIEVDERDLAVLRNLATDELNSGFDRKRRIADAAGAGNEGYDDWLVRRETLPRGGADPPEDVEDFLRQPAPVHPVGVPGLYQSLVVPGGNLAAYGDKKEVFVIPVDGVDQSGEILFRRRRRQHH